MNNPFTNTDIDRFEKNVAEAEKEYQRLLAHLRQLPRNSSTEQIAGLVDDLNRAQSVITYYRNLLRLARS